jgi:hypothetical protein
LAIGAGFEFSNLTVNERVYLAFQSQDRSGQVRHRIWFPLGEHD